jgi:hypothetical protein
LAGIEPTPARPNGAGYARLNLPAEAGIKHDIMILIFAYPFFALFFL